MYHAIEAIVNDVYFVVIQELYILYIHGSYHAVVLLYSYVTI